MHQLVDMIIGRLSVCVCRQCPIIITNYIVVICIMIPTDTEN